MILRSVMRHVRDQNWFAVGLDFLIVIVGVFIGIQVANWNDARLDEQRRVQVVDALRTSLMDAISVQRRFIAEIDQGLSTWEAEYAQDERPAPFYYRIDGSETAPDTWSTFEQMQLTDLFDPVTLFDLSFFYSELDGIGRRYLRYVAFVEERLLPDLIRGHQAFYDTDGVLIPEYRANMDRLRDYRTEIERMNLWAECLIQRLSSDRTFEQSCRRAGFTLPVSDGGPQALEGSTP